MKKKNKSNKKYLLITIIVICSLLIGGLSVFINQKNNSRNNNSISNEVFKPNKPEQNEPIVNSFEQEVFNDEDKKIDMSKVLKELQNGTRKIITKTNEYTFNEYLKLNNYNEDYVKYYYSMLDLDDDGILEIVIFVEGYNEIVLNYNNNVVYGYNDITIHNLKVDGTFLGRTNDNREAIVKLETNKAEYQKEIQATQPYYTNSPEYLAAEEKYNNFYNNWDKKENIKYTYVYNNKEYQQTDFEIKNNLVHKNKERIEKLTYLAIDIRIRAGFGCGCSYCGEVNSEEEITIESEDSFASYLRSKTYNSIKDLNKYWKKYFTLDYLKGIEKEFIEKNNKLYCNCPAKGPARADYNIYDIDKTRIKVLSENNNEIIVIGRVWTKETPNDATSSNSYSDIYLKLIKSNEGILVIDNYVIF